MSAIGQIGNILGGGIVGAIGSVIDDLFTNDEERAEAKLKLLQMQQAGRFKELELSLSAIIAEAQSSDPYTSRARPTFLYVIYLVILVCLFGGIAGGLVDPDRTLRVAETVANLLHAIPESLYWLFGAGYLGYTGGRSFDKWQKDRAK